MNKISNFFNINNIHSKGYLGQGITTAVLDTGIYPHLDFTHNGNRILAFKDFIYNKHLPYDDNGHGTHISGIICGNGYCSNGFYKGIAPKSNIVALKVLDKYGNGDIKTMIQGLKWIFQNMSQYNIRIINLSVGSVSNDTSKEHQLLSYVEHAWDLGLVVLTASGNLGPAPMSITLPGTSKKVITVGCSDNTITPSSNFGKKSSSNYSGCGPTSECIVKPEIVAPGTSITSCFPSRNRYIQKSGSSMSTPIVAGAIALLLSKHPNYTNKQVKMCLHSCAVDLNKPKNQQGWGLIDFNSLLNI